MNALTRLASVAMRVPDPGATAAWLRDALGFHTTPHGDGVEVTTDGDYGIPAPWCALRLLPGDGPAVDEVVFEAPGDYDFAGLAGRLAEFGGAVAKEADGVVFTAASGLRLACRRDLPELGEALPPSALRPRRLGHVNLLAPDPPEVARLLAEAYGMKLSERLGERFYFLRFRTEHHNMAVRPGAGSGAHHIAFEVNGWESYRVILDHLADLGLKVEYGPGRHAPGRNLFVYLRDPSSGLRLELFADMAHIQDEESYVPKVWSPSDRPNTVNRWGPAPPESFL